MRKATQEPMIALTVALCFGTVAQSLAEESKRNRSIEYEMKVQRACEVAIWAMPAVSVYDIELSIQRDLGGNFGDIAYFTKPMTSRHGFLTANDVTPYVTSGLSCQGHPLVVEAPPAGEKASFFGTFVNAWQTPIADVGPPGADKGKGGKYLFLAPDYEGEVPSEGYFVYRPATYSVNFCRGSTGGRLPLCYGGTLADRRTCRRILLLDHLPAEEPGAGNVLLDRSA